MLCGKSRFFLPMNTLYLLACLMCIVNGSIGVNSLCMFMFIRMGVYMQRKDI